MGGKNSGGLWMCLKLSRKKLNNILTADSLIFGHLTKLFEQRHDL